MEDSSEGIRSILELPDVTIMESVSPKYHDRTVRNAAWADLTVAFAVDFSTPGERLTARAAGDRYLAVNLPDTPEGFRDEKLQKRAAELLSRKTEGLDRFRLNVAGNGLETLEKRGISQRDADAFVSGVIGYALAGGMRVAEVRSGGQSGIDESGTRAAMSYGIRSSVLCPRGFLRNDSRGLPHWDRSSFASRFESVERRPAPDEEFDVRKAFARDAESVDGSWRPGRESLLPGAVAGDIIGSPYASVDAGREDFEMFSGVHGRDRSWNPAPTVNTQLCVLVSRWLSSGKDPSEADLSRLMYRAGLDRRSLTSDNVAVAASMTGLRAAGFPQVRELAGMVVGAFGRVPSHETGAFAAAEAVFMAAHGRQKHEIRFAMDLDYNIDVSLAGAGVRAAAMRREGRTDDEIAVEMLQMHGVQVGRVHSMADGETVYTIDEILPRTHLMETRTVLVNGEPLSWSEPTGRRNTDSSASLPLALAAFDGTFTFEEAVRRAVSVGGDTPSVAALTGALCAAYYGGVPRDIASRCSVFLDGRDLSALMRFAGERGERTAEPLNPVPEDMKERARVLFGEVARYAEAVRTALEMKAGWDPYAGGRHLEFPTARYPVRKDDVVEIYDHGMLDGAVGIDRSTGLLKVMDAGALRDGEYRDADWCREHVFSSGVAMMPDPREVPMEDGWRRRLAAEGIRMGGEEMSSLSRLRSRSSPFTEDIDGIKASIARLCLDEGIGVADPDRVSNVSLACADAAAMDIPLSNTLGADDPAVRTRMDDGLFNALSRFSEGFRVVARDGRFNLEDREGKTLLNSWYPEVLPFCGGFARVRTDDGLWNYVDREGCALLERGVGKAHAFRDGRAEIVSDGKPMTVDKLGRVSDSEECARVHARGVGL